MKIENSKLVVALAVISQIVWSASYSLAAPTKAQKWVVNLDQGTGNTEFLAIGRPSALKILGKGAAPRGSFTLGEGSVVGSATFELTSLDTGISLRNEHMKNKYLEVGKYPTAKFTLTQLALPSEKFSQSDFLVDQIPFQGKLFLHGVEKPVSGTARVERKGAQLSLEAKFGLSIDDYAIATPGFSGITMAKDVQVTVKTAAPMVLQAE